MKNKIVTNYILSIVYGIFALFLFSGSTQLRAETINSYDEYSMFSEFSTIPIDGLSVIDVRDWTHPIRTGYLSYASLSAYAEFDLFSRSARESTFLTFTIRDIQTFGTKTITSPLKDIEAEVSFYDPLSLSIQNRFYLLTAKNPRELQYEAKRLFNDSPAITYQKTLQVGDTISIDMTKGFNAAVEAKLVDLGVKFWFSGDYSNVFTLEDIRLTDSDLTSQVN
ncbi:MAG: hypothetical protein KAG19_07020 [Methylococcales bacterium]|nr:hypothetical protein [Methylococcales bacterium]